MDRYLISPGLLPKYWICTDTIYRFRCFFFARELQIDYDLGILEGFSIAASSDLDKYVLDMKSWIKKHHPDKY